MGRLEFGLTMLIVGMGGTLLTLAFCSLVMYLLKRAFPLMSDQERASR